MPQQRLWQAVEALTASADPIQDRLFSASEYLVHLLPDDFQDADRDEFISVMDALNTRDAAGDEGSLRATTAVMGDDEAVEIARRIFALDSAYRPLT